VAGENAVVDVLVDATSCVFSPPTMDRVIVNMFECITKERLAVFTYFKVTPRVTTKVEPTAGVFPLVGFTVKVATLPVPFEVLSKLKLLT
jgi:hypothetical protein